MAGEARRQNKQEVSLRLVFHDQSLQSVGPAQLTACLNSFVLTSFIICQDDCLLSAQPGGPHCRYLRKANINTTGPRKLPQTDWEFDLCPRTITATNHRTVESRHNNQSEWKKPTPLKLNLQCTKPQQMHICFSFLHCTRGHCSILILLVLIVCSRAMTTKACDLGFDYSNIKFIYNKILSFKLSLIRFLLKHSCYITYWLLSSFLQ